MQLVTHDLITAAFERLDKMPPPEVAALFSRFEKEQPALYTFFGEAGEDIFDEAEQDCFFYTGNLIYYLARESNNGKMLPRVSEDTLIAATEHYSRNLDQIAALRGEALEQGFRKLFGEHRQTALLEFVLETILPDEDAELRETSKPWLVIYLKSAIDSLDR